MIKGAIFSEEHKKHLSESHIGNPGYWNGKSFSDDHRRNLSIARRKRVTTQETRLKISRANRGKNTGVNNGMYKHGLTNLHSIYYHSSEHKEWRKAVFERDGYTCKICDKKGSKLHPHHILPKCDFKELRTEVWNGITLCKECHTKTIRREYEYVNRFLRYQSDKLQNPTVISPRITLDNSMKIEPSKCI